MQFCCSGCKTVYQVIHDAGLANFYKIKEQTDADKQAALKTGRAYDALDDDEFLASYTRTINEDLSEVELYLQGVHCAACVWLVEKLPLLQTGCLESRLDLARQLVTIRWNPQTHKLSEMARALDSLGYSPHPARDHDRRRARVLEDRKHMIRLAAAGAAAGNTMLLAFALYGGMIDGIEAGYGHFFRWVSMLIAWFALLWPGRVFLQGAYSALRAKTTHLDVPIAIGLLAAALTGTVNTFTGIGDIYFESLSILIFLLLAGRFVQHRQQRWAMDSLELLYSFTPEYARVVKGNDIVESALEAVQLGDVLQVLAGEVFPADGVVCEGESYVDSSLLTGESDAQSKSKGDVIYAGTTNMSATLRMKVEASGRESRVGKLMSLVETFGSRKAPVVQWADRISGYFVLVLLFLAALTCLVWYFLDPSQAIDNATSLLIVSCPCALGLATPLALAVATGRAARKQILVKGGDALQHLSGTGKVFLDKTGTITEGKVSVVEVVGPKDMLPLASALESHSSHPLAKAISALNPHLGSEATEVEQHVGEGIAGVVDNQRVRVGTFDFVSKLVNSDAAIEYGDNSKVSELQAQAADWAQSGLSPVWISVNDQVCTCLAMGDPIRKDAKRSIETLQQLGWSVAILSGDHTKVVDHVGSQLGITNEDNRGGLSPEEKLSIVEEWQAKSPVVMVGDGLNDAAALSVASVGIAVHGGAEASLAAADIYLNKPGLKALLELVLGSRNTMLTVKLCLGLSLLYNIITASLAIMGIINPLIAAILMPLSSLSVLVLAFSSKAFRRAL
ncbi:MAG: heavy metal translocating P-type ATPase [Planctomycetes bacterium]|nr:heavy metal translocating P-type ATPase [Planctomycetota bacterium]